MTAREMFKKLGYKYNKYRDRNQMIEYRKEDSTSVLFWIKERKFSVSEYCEPKDITVDEFEAVQKQMEELGWVEEEKQEIKQETNIEHYKDGIIELCVDDLAISKGKVVKCCATPCSECDFEDKNGHCIGNREIMKWLKQPYIKPVYKLTKFEIDLLQSCSQGYSPKYQFKNINSLTEMRKNGYFKCINRDETIEEILAKCEVVG